jgi:hypothetical protein
VQLRVLIEAEHFGVLRLQLREGGVGVADRAGESGILRHKTLDGGVVQAAGAGLPAVIAQFAQHVDRLHGYLRLRRPSGAVSGSTKKEMTPDSSSGRVFP